MNRNKEIGNVLVADIHQIVLNSRPRHITIIQSILTHFSFTVTTNRNYSPYKIGLTFIMDPYLQHIHSNAGMRILEIKIRDITY